MSKLTDSRSSSASRRSREHQKRLSLAIEPRVAYLYPPFDDQPKSTHFILKNLKKQDVCFKVRSRQSRHIEIRVSPSSGLIYQYEDSLTIKVSVEPIKNKALLERIANGKEKLEMQFLSVAAKRVMNDQGSAVVADWWNRTDVPIEEHKTLVMLVKSLKEINLFDDSQTDRSSNTGSSRPSAFGSVFSKDLLPKSQRPGPSWLLAGVSKFENGGQKQSFYGNDKQQGNKQNPKPTAKKFLQSFNGIKSNYDSTNVNKGIPATDCKKFTASRGSRQAPLFNSTFIDEKNYNGQEPREVANATKKKPPADFKNNQGQENCRIRVRGPLFSSTFIDDGDVNNIDERPLSDSEQKESKDQDNRRTLIRRPLLNSTFMDDNRECNGCELQDAGKLIFNGQNADQDKLEASSMSICEEEDKSFGCPARTARIQEKQMILRGEITREELERQRRATRVRRPVEDDSGVVIHKLSMADFLDLEEQKQRYVYQPGNPPKLLDLVPDGFNTSDTARLELFTESVKSGQTTQIMMNRQLPQIAINGQTSSLPVPAEVFHTVAKLGAKKDVNLKAYLRSNKCERKENDAYHHDASSVYNHDPLTATRPPRSFNTQAETTFASVTSAIDGGPSSLTGAVSKTPFVNELQAVEVPPAAEQDVATEEDKGYSVKSESNWEYEVEWQYGSSKSQNCGQAHLPFDMTQHFSLSREHLLLQSGLQLQLGRQADLPDQDGSSLEKNHDSGQAQSLQDANDFLSTLQQDYNCGKAESISQNFDHGQAQTTQGGRPSMSSVAEFKTSSPTGSVILCGATAFNLRPGYHVQRQEQTSDIAKSGSLKGYTSSTSRCIPKTENEKKKECLDAKPEDLFPSVKRLYDFLEQIPCENYTKKDAEERIRKITNKIDNKHWSFNSKFRALFDENKRSIAKANCKLDKAISEMDQAIKRAEWSISRVLED